MTYGTEAVVPAKIDEPSLRMENSNSDLNDQGLSLNSDILKIKWDKDLIRMVANQRAAARSFNIRVRVRQFKAGDLVLKKIAQKQGIFSPNWEGPFRVTKSVLSGSYRLEELDGIILPHLWNVDNLRKYYFLSL